MRDNEDRHLALAADHPLKPVDRLDVEMVRRLVKQQDVGLRENRLLETGAADLTAGTGMRRRQISIDA